MTTQQYHNIKRLLKEIKHNVHETKSFLKPDFVKSLEVTEEYNAQLWNNLPDDKKQRVMEWWEQEWGETIDEEESKFRTISEKLFLKFFTIEKYSF